MRETHLRCGRQTVKLGLIKVVNDLFPDDKLKTSYSILEGVFCNLEDSVLSIREVKQIKQKLINWVEHKSNIALLKREDGYYHYQVDNMIIKSIYPANTNSGEVEPFEIYPFSYGFIVDFSNVNIEKGGVLIPPYRLSTAYEKNQRWMNNIDIELVSDINSYIDSGKSQKLISISEALHEKEIADIADMILQQRRTLRVLLIAGPSSSGKTSFAQRLCTQLEVNGLKPVSLSLDDYFLNRDKTPLDENGNYDLDSIDALDIEFLLQQIKSLIKGETIDAPIYDFITGTRSSKTKKTCLNSSEILVIEGIHALNPRLMANINRNLLFKIYVSALGGLNVNLTSRVPTTEIRLIRRLVRDERYRGTDPQTTLERWINVRKSEYTNIFSFQEEADVMFNSSMLYEMNALRPFAEDTLKKIKDNSPFYETKQRLINLLSFFEPIDTEKIPFNSILREFIGGSIYF